MAWHRMLPSQQRWAHRWLLLAQIAAEGKFHLLLFFFNIFFFSLLPPPVAVCGSRRASQHPQRFANPLLYYPHQEGGCGPDRHAGRNHRHHSHHCPVAPQAGTKSRCEWNFNERYLRGKVKEGEQFSRADCPRWPTVPHGCQSRRLPGLCWQRGHNQPLFYCELKCKILFVVIVTLVLAVMIL